MGISDSALHKKDDDAASTPNEDEVPLVDKSTTPEVEVKDAEPTSRLSLPALVKYVQEGEVRKHLAQKQVLENEMAEWQVYRSSLTTMEDVMLLEDQLAFLQRKLDLVNKQVASVGPVLPRAPVDLAFYINEALSHIAVGEQIRYRQSRTDEWKCIPLTKPIEMNDFWTLRPNISLPLKPRPPLEVRKGQRVLAKHPKQEVWANATIKSIGFFTIGVHFEEESTSVYHYVSSSDLLSLRVPDEGILLSSKTVERPNGCSMYTRSNCRGCSQRYLPYQLPGCSVEETVLLCNWFLDRVKV